jgi:hypothetical protein
MKEYFVFNVPEGADEKTVPELKDAQKVYYDSVHSEGYGSKELGLLIIGLCSKTCPLQFIGTDSGEYGASAYFKAAEGILLYLHKHGAVKINKNNALPQAATNFIVDNIVSKNILKIFKREKVFVEALMHSISWMTVLLEICEFTKMDKKIISITPEGIKAVEDSPLLYFTLMELFTRKVHWQMFDGIDDSRLGRLGLGYTLLLLHIHGKRKHSLEWYAKKYFSLLPRIKEDFESTPHASEYTAEMAYCERTFICCLQPMGLAEIIESNTSFEKWTVKKTKFFDKVISISPPAKEKV